LEIALFNFNGSANFFNFLFDICGFIFGNGFFDRLGNTFHQILRFFESQAGDSANNLDNLNLFGAEAGENRIKLGFFFSRSSSGSTRSAAAIIGAAAETPNFSSNSFTRAESSNTVIPSINLTTSSLVISDIFIFLSVCFLLV